MSTKPTELAGLKIDKAKTEHVSYKSKHKPVLIVMMLFLVTLGLFAYVGKDQFLPATPVEVANVMAVKASGTTLPEGELAFQSAGWVEPAPYPIKVTSLVSGVVESIHIIEGATVKKGDLIAELSDVDFLLDLKKVEAEKRQLEYQLSVIDGEYKAAQAETKHIDARLNTAKAQLEKYVALAELYDQSKGTLPKINILKAKQDVSIQESIIAEIESERAILEAAEEAIKARKLSKQSGMDLIANQYEKLELALKRTKIYAPTDGVILRKYVSAGSRVNIDAGSPDASIIAEMYEPENLQVRVDVPLSDASGLSVGQDATVRVDILPDQEFKGTVTSIVGRADIARNTLQAKVRIDKPVNQFRPEMLAKVQFMSFVDPKAAESVNEERMRVFVPESSIQDGDKVWVVDRVHNVVESQQVVLGIEKRSGWLEVISGLKVGQQVVVNPQANMTTGMRVKINGTRSE